MGVKDSGWGNGGDTPEDLSCINPTLAMENPPL